MSILAYVEVSKDGEVVKDPLSTGITGRRLGKGCYELRGILAYVEVSKDGEVVKDLLSTGITGRRLGKGCYELRGLLSDWRTIVAQPKPLPVEDCATLCVSPHLGEQTFYVYAVVTLDALRIDGDGRLRWLEMTEAVDADFSVVVL